MVGAREYAGLFKTGQYGRLFIESGSHTRGKTFHIWVLPKDVVCVRLPRGLTGAVEVYGIQGRQPGWTEYYGWLHKGRWQQDFRDLVAQRRKELAQQEQKRSEERQRIEEEKHKRAKELLEMYE